MIMMMKIAAICSYGALMLPAAMVLAFQSPMMVSKTSPATSTTALLDSRRDVLVAGTMTAAVLGGGLMLDPFPAAAAARKSKGPDYQAAANDIMALVTADPDKGPTLVRLAWHSSGTYDKMTKTGGSGQGTIRFQEELAHGGNAGLGDTAVPWLETIHAKHPNVSYADLYTLAGVAAIKAMGGPTIPWRAGRVDAVTPDGTVTPDGRLPNADSGPKGADPSDADHLRTVFYRMGFDDREIVALSGAHALGRCHPTASGYDGPWTPTPTTFNNAYFTLLLNLKWTPKTWDGPYQVRSFCFVVLFAAAHFSWSFCQDVFCFWSSVSHMCVAFIPPFFTTHTTVRRRRFGSSHDAPNRFGFVTR
jgi:cytochrome c peroxidase